MSISHSVAAVATFAPFILKSLDPIAWLCFIPPSSKKFHSTVGKSLGTVVPCEASISVAGRRRPFPPTSWRRF
jgi:hypothetical protein